ncbi:Hsp70 family protein [Actinoplanes sp. CA-142083]|uniref:Hsp70 family protein n=1 Tax=Actinoplanes sp. CA-142083 TaxID=3239903 RepID=UPI003D9150CE
MTDIHGFVLGVDLGTSHTVAMPRHPDGRTRPLLFDGKPLLPSAVYLDTTGRLHVGADALRLGQAEPGRLEPNPKRHVDAGSVQLGETTIGVADLFAALLGAVAREAVATAGQLPPAILTYPAAWGAPRRAVLTEALGKAGWPPGARLVPEPVAAARYFADILRRPVPSGASLAVFDFGGGTLDVAVVRNDGPGEGGRPTFSVTASGGADDLGGLDLDAALVEHLGKALAGAEPEAWHRLTDPVTLAGWRARRQFWEDVRGAKEMLSRASFAPVPVPGVEHAVHLTRDELEAAIDPLVRRGVTEAAAVLDAAGLRAPDLAGLFLVGGSSRVPLVARRLHAELGIAPTVLEQPELPVAEGAILAAGYSTASASSGAFPAANGSAASNNAARSNTPAGNAASGSAASGSAASGSAASGSAASNNAARSNAPAGNAASGSAASNNAARSNAPAGNAAGGSAASGNAAGGHDQARFAPGMASAATPSVGAPSPPTVNPATLHESSPPITDTRAEPAPVAGPPTPVPAQRQPEHASQAPRQPEHAPQAPRQPEHAPQAPRQPEHAPSGSRTAERRPAGRVPEEDTDERLRSEPVDPWATGEAAALAAAGHDVPPLTPVSPSAGPISSPPPASTSSPPAATSSPPAATSSPPVTSPPPFGAHQQPGHQQPGARQQGSGPNNAGYQGGGHQAGYQHGGAHHTGYQQGGAQHTGYQQGGGWAPAGSPAAHQQRVAHPGAHDAAPHAQPGGWGPGATTPGAAPARRGLRKRSYAIIAAAVTLTLAAGSALAWYFWAGNRAIDYQPLSEPTRIAALVPVSSDWSDAEILGDRAYFASSDSSSGTVGVVAMRLGGTKPLWSNYAPGSAKGGWKSMVALPVGIALFSETNSEDSTRRLVVLGADGGSVLWDRTIGSQDVVLFAGGSAVVADRVGHKLIGLRLADGKQRWSLDDPKTTYPTDTNVLALTTPKDLNGPATVFGRPYQPDLADDPRIVQIAADKSARVIDAETGKVVASRQNVAEPNDEVVAHNGRLIVLQPDDKQIVAYDLGKFGDAQPKVLYTVQTPNSQMKYVAPCGDDRVCFDEEVGYDGKTATIRALDVADGGQLWNYPLPNIESIVAVGESTLVTTTNSEMTLLDPAGRKIWTHTGEAARLDAGNILEFSKPLSRSPGETALYGRHIGDDAVPLGSLTDMRADTCSWDKSTLACVAEKDFVLQTFAK